MRCPEAFRLTAFAICALACFAVAAVANADPDPSPKTTLGTASCTPCDSYTARPMHPRACGFFRECVCGLRQGLHAHGCIQHVAYSLKGFHTFTDIDGNVTDDPTVRAIAKLGLCEPWAAEAVTKAPRVGCPGHKDFVADFQERAGRLQPPPTLATDVLQLAVDILLVFLVVTRESWAENISIHTQVLACLAAILRLQSFFVPVLTPATSPFTIYGACSALVLAAGKIVVLLVFRRKRNAAATTSKGSFNSSGLERDCLVWWWVALAAIPCAMGASVGVVAVYGTDTPLLRTGYHTYILTVEALAVLPQFALVSRSLSVDTMPATVFFVYFILGVVQQSAASAFLWLPWCPGSPWRWSRQCSNLQPHGIPPPAEIIFVFVQLGIYIVAYLAWLGYVLVLLQGAFAKVRELRRAHGTLMTYPSTEEKHALVDAEAGKR